MEEREYEREWKRALMQEICLFEFVVLDEATPSHARAAGVGAGVPWLAVRMPWRVVGGTFQRRRSEHAQDVLARR